MIASVTVRTPDEMLFDKLTVRTVETSTSKFVPVWSATNTLVPPSVSSLVPAGKVMLKELARRPRKSAFPKPGVVLSEEV